MKGSNNSYTTEFRQYDPRVARWLSTDPKFQERPSLNPYNFVSNSPLTRVDQKGDLDDDIHLNDNGVVTKVVENDQPNRFFDKEGSELKFNDADNADNHMLNSKFEKGDKVFNPVSNTKLRKGVNSAGIEPLFLNKMGKPTGASLVVAYKSYGKADFTFSYLSKNFKINNGGTDGDGLLRYGVPDQAGYFKFENSNTIFNLYDAGNFMWGNYMKLNGFSETGSRLGAHINSIMSFDGLDTDADQSAIKQGFNYSYEE